MPGLIDNGGRSVGRRTLATADSSLSPEIHAQTQGELVESKLFFKRVAAEAIAEQQERT